MDRKAFVRLALKLALPIMIQNLISTLVNTADTIMLGYVNQTAMSATSLANQFTFILFCFFYGMSAGTSVLCAQYWGKGDVKTIEKVIGLATRLSVLISIVFFAAGFFFPRQILSLFTDSELTIVAGSEYLRWVSISYLLMGIAQMYLSGLRSVGKVVFPSALYIISLVTNVVFNGIFIFGWLGAPKMGVAGAAIGTLIARAVEVIVCIAYSVFFSNVKLHLHLIFAKTGILFTDFLKISIPAIVNDVVWSLATTVFAAILGHIGDDMVAANAVAVMVVNIGAIACRGFANATTIIVSNALGEDKMEEAKLYAKRMLFITFLVSLLGCVIILAVKPFILAYYSDKLTKTALSYLGYLMIMTTWRLVGEAVNTCLICGCFRGGGDSRFGMIVDVIFMWIVAVPLMAIAAYWLKWPPLWVYFVMTLDEYWKMPVVFIHFFRFRWLNNITRDEKELVGE